MEKICVFCGQHPAKKNKEHVLPLWLIEFTGDPKRKVTFGPINFPPNYAHQKGPESLNISFDQFTFPACEQCNTAFSKLENTSKDTMMKIFHCLPITSWEMHWFLNWFDKVRIGLWLG